MAAGRLLPPILLAGVLAACGSGSSSPMTVGQVCDKYSAAVKQSLPPSLPPPVPQNFAAGLARNAAQACLQQASRLRYGSPNRTTRRVVIAPAQAEVLIHDLTVNTTVHVSL